MNQAGDYFDEAGQYLGRADDYYTNALAQGTQGLTGAADMFGRYSQANLSPAQQYMRDSVSQMGQTGPNFGQALSATQQGMTRGRQAYTDVDLRDAQGAMNRSVSQMQGAGPNFNQALAAARQGMNQAGFGTAESTLGRGISSLGRVTGEFDPASADRFMNPYQQKVIDESLRQIGRQGLQAQQQLQAQAVRSGAFGGSREGIQRAELGRGLAESQNAAIVGGLSSGYQSALQQAQQAFESQKQRQLAQAQGYQSAAGLAGSLASQQGQLALQGSQQMGTLEAQRAQFAQNAARYGGDVAQQIANQQLQRGQLGLSAAQMDLQGGQQMGALEAQRSQLAQNIARYRGDIGQQLASQAFQQAGLGQSAAGQLASIAGQRYTMGSQTGAGLGALATQYGTLGGQQANLGMMSQQLGQQDVNFLYGLGSIQQQQKQRELDALRQTKLQQAYQPYQQLAFESDIMRGAPSTQMSFTQQLAPTPSAFQQAAGAVTGGVATAAAAKQAGVF
jgi:hypothetical protein